MKMKFVNRLVQPETQVRIQLAQDERHLDLLYNNILVGFFADGELYLCSFSSASENMCALEGEGVKFTKVKSANYYQIKINDDK